MPLYDFKCHECGMVSEILIRSVDAQAIRCPECGSSNLERLVCHIIRYDVISGREGELLKKLAHYIWLLLI